MLFDEHIRDKATNAQQLQVKSLLPPPKKAPTRKKQKISASQVADSKSRLSTLVAGLGSSSITVPEDPYLDFFSPGTNAEEVKAAQSLLCASSTSVEECVDCLRVLYPDVNLEFEVEGDEVAVYTTSTIKQGRYLQSIFGELTLTQTNWPVSFDAAVRPSENIYIRPSASCLLPHFKVTAEGNLRRARYNVTAEQVRKCETDQRLFRARTVAIVQKTIQVEQGGRVRLNWKDDEETELNPEDFFYTDEISSDWDDKGQESTPSSPSSFESDDSDYATAQDTPNDANSTASTAVDSGSTGY